MDIYQEIIIDHYRNPRNFGTLATATTTASTKNISCGDELSFAVRIENDIVREIAFMGSGCAISIASASLLSEFAKGKSTEVLSKMNKDAILELIGVPIGPARMKCALLSLETLQKVIASHNSNIANNS